MTISSLLSPSVQADFHSTATHVPYLDRTDWSGGGGGWKGGKGNPNSALSALTLLAFLFFLNMLQSCLKDTISQDTPMVVMMMPTTTAATLRGKRDTQEEENNNMDEPRFCHNWTDSEITNLVHKQVEMYWANKEAIPRKSHVTKKYAPFINITHTSNFMAMHDKKLKNEVKAVTKLNMALKSKNGNNKKGEIYYNDKGSGVLKDNTLNLTILEPTTIITRAVKVITTLSRPYAEKWFCCDLLKCETEKMLEHLSNKKIGIYQITRQTLFWLCKNSSITSCETISADKCPNQFSLLLIDKIRNFFAT